jgi:hypothetical protein
MKQFLYLAVFLAPFPFFIDFQNVEFILRRGDPENVGEMFEFKPGFPLPIAFLSFICCFVFGFINESYCVARCKRRLSILNTTIFFGIALFFLIFILMGVKISTVIQVFLPVLILIFIPRYNEQLMMRCLRYYCYGIGVWLVLHLSSIIIDSFPNLIEIDRYYVFSTIFGYQIYQSLVSYPSTFSLFIIAALLSYLLGQIRKSFMVALLSLSMVLGFISQTRLFVLDLLGIIVSVLVAFVLGAIAPKRFRFLEFFPLAAVGLLGAIFYTGRLAQESAFDRFALISEAITEILNNSDLLFWGEGLAHSYAHNFFLNFVLNFGLLAASIYLIFFALAIFQISRTLVNDRQRSFFGFLLLLIILTNSTFNAAITQPLFAANAAILLMFIVNLQSGYKSPDSLVRQ